MAVAAAVADSIAIATATAIRITARGRTMAVGRDEQPPEMLEVDESEIISQADLAATKSSMNLSVLKAKPIYELVKMADSHGRRGHGPLAQAGHHLRHPQGALA